MVLMGGDNGKSADDTGAVYLSVLTTAAGEW